MDELIERGEKLRLAGIRSLQFGDYHVEFVPYEAPQPRVANDPPRIDPEDPLLDPLTYGRRPDGPVPGFGRRGNDEE